MRFTKTQVEEAKTKAFKAGKKSAFIGKSLIFLLGLLIGIEVVLLFDKYGDSILSKFIYVQNASANVSKTIAKTTDITK